MICFDAVERELGFVLELERAVAGADGDGQAVDPGALRRNPSPAPDRSGTSATFFSIFLGIEADDVFFDAAEHAQFGFDHHAGGMGEPSPPRRSA